jgi:hypothetical protein
LYSQKVHPFTALLVMLIRRRHRAHATPSHRLSKDIDIFINDPQFLGYLTPRLSPTAESLTTQYIEDHKYVKLVFSEGEIDFVAAPPLTAEPAHRDTVRSLGRIERYNSILRENFAELATLEHMRSFDECVEIVMDALGRA